jgi:preprotein translocase subunit SecA
MATSDKEFVINEAATCGQITISSAVFGRGTDLFCKDDRVQINGGVHVIQAFLSEELSEEIKAALPAKARRARIKWFF